MWKVLFENARGRASREMYIQLKFHREMGFDGVGNVKN